MEIGSNGGWKFSASQRCRLLCPVEEVSFLPLDWRQWSAAIGSEAAWERNGTSLFFLRENPISTIRISCVVGIENTHLVCTSYRIWQKVTWINFNKEWDLMWPILIPKRLVSSAIRVPGIIKRISSLLLLCTFEFLVELNRNQNSRWLFSLCKDIAYFTSGKLTCDEQAQLTSYMSHKRAGEMETKKQEGWHGTRYN